MATLVSRVLTVAFEKRNETETEVLSFYNRQVGCFGLTLCAGSFEQPPLPTVYPEIVELRR